MQYLLLICSLAMLIVGATAQTTIYPGDLDTRFPSFNLRFDADT